jgi:hypothetical protein
VRTYAFPSGFLLGAASVHIPELLGKVQVVFFSAARQHRVVARNMPC